MNSAAAVPVAEPSIGGSLIPLPTCYNYLSSEPEPMTLTSTWNPCRHGDRIGTPYQEQRLSYCQDDNTYTEHPITLRARACRLDWAPITRPEPTTDLFTELFGDT